jgi:hypothetical protein
MGYSTGRAGTFRNDTDGAPLSRMLKETEMIYEQVLAFPLS